MFGNQEVPNNSTAWGGFDPSMLTMLGSFGSNGGGAEMPDPNSGLTLFQERQLDQGQQLIDLQTPTGFQKGVGGFGTITQGLASLANIYMGLKGMKLQKEAFKFNKDVTNTNLNNSITDYNRRLTDTLSNRALNNGQGQGWISEQLAKYSAKRS